MLALRKAALHVSVHHLVMHRSLSAMTGMGAGAVWLLLTACGFAWLCPRGCAAPAVQHFEQCKCFNVTGACSVLCENFASEQRCECAYGHRPHATWLCGNHVMVSAAGRGILKWYVPMHGKSYYWVDAWLSLCKCKQQQALSSLILQRCCHHIKAARRSKPAAQTAAARHHERSCTPPLENSSARGTASAET